jgi:tRNA U55 pseudouridine synthase TruB
MSALERTAIGRFRVDEAVKIDELTAETLPNSLQPALCVVADLQRVYMSDRQLTEIRHGRPIPKPEAPVSLSNASNEWTAVVGANNLVAILIEKHPGQLWPIKNFF